MRMINIIIAVILFMGNAAFADYKAGKAAYDAGDYQTAYNQLLPLAEAGDAKAQIKLGHLYRKGLFVEMNEIKAENLYFSALKKNTPVAAYSLYLLYLKKLNVPTKVRLRGLTWLYISYNLKYPSAEDVVKNLIPNSKLPLVIIDKAKLEANKWLLSR